MNRLWVRLSLVFSVVVVVSLAAIAIISIAIIRANRAELSQLNDGERVSQAVEAVAPDKVDTSLRYVPVAVDGQIVAYLDIARLLRPPPGPLQFLNWEEVLLIIAVVAAAVGVLFGFLMSRTLAAPLNALAATADAIGAGDLERRVSVRGTTEIRSLAQSFNKMVDQLQRNETLRRNLVADIAHELRTPITALQANIYAILDDAYPLTKDEIAGLYEQIRVLSRLVKDLHELSQAEAGQLPLDRKPADFSQLLRELVAPFHMVSESKGVQLVVDIPADLPQVSVDEERMNQVMHNLLNNALQHTPSGGTIFIHLRRSGDFLSVDVQDTGEGIAPEHLPYVFERFYRAEYARSRKTGGMGLGLAITKAIVEAHEGQISVASAGIAGKGTTFTLRLPIIRPPQ